MRSRHRKWLLIIGLLSSMWANGGAAEYALQLKHEFFPGPGLPSLPHGKLLEVSDGEFVGVSSYGGSSNYGTLFKIGSNGSLDVLHSFDGTNGSFPTGGVTEDDTGNLFGMTAEGGAWNQGTIYRASLAGEFESLYSFSGTNGSEPLGSLLVASDGAFYGCTFKGGAYDKGTIFRVGTNDGLQTIHSFDGTNGAGPAAALVEAGSGKLYGTTEYGGNGGTSIGSGYGLVFCISTDGSFEVKHAFSRGDGSMPTGRLCLASDGALYGTTGFGGLYDVGTVFRLTVSNEFSSLYSFDPQYSAAPYAGLTEGRDGQLYGTTIYSFEESARTNGTIFRISTGGVHQTLFKLDGTNGTNPFNGLTVGRDGNLYAALGDALAHLSPSGSAGTFIKLLTLPTITSFVLTNGGFVIEWDSIPGQFYEVYQHDVLNAPETWVDTESMWATGFVSRLTVPVFHQPQGFYKVGLVDEPLPP